MSIFDEVTAHLPRDLQTAMDAAIAAGRYESRASIVEDACYLWFDQELLREAKLVKLRELIEEGQQGPSYPADEVFSELRERLAARQRKAEAAE